MRHEKEATVITLQEIKAFEQLAMEKDAHRAGVEGRSFKCCHRLFNGFLRTTLWVTDKWTRERVGKKSLSLLLTQAGWLRSCYAAHPGLELAILLPSCLGNYRMLGLQGHVHHHSRPRSLSWRLSQWDHLWVPAPYSSHAWPWATAACALPRLEVSECTVAMADQKLAWKIIERKEDYH